MNYPSIGDYLDAQTTEGAGLWRSMTPMRPTYDPDGEATYSSGNFGVVFCATDAGANLHAIKCFTRPAVGRAEAYDRLARELPRGSDYLIAHRYLRDELSVWNCGAFGTFDLLDMEWVEGPTLHTAICQAARLGERTTLQQYYAAFLALAQWLVGSGLAHGDLKPENIIATPSGALKLVDYDAMFLPSMLGEAQREVGTPAWQHPLRPKMAFSPAIDHYPIALIAASLDALSQLPELLDRFAPTSGGLLFDPEKAVAGVDPAIELLEQYGLCGQWLELLQSPTPELPTLSQALEVGSTPKSELPWVAFAHKGRWGFRKAGSDQEIAPIFDRVLPFSEGRAAVSINNRWGYINAQGEPVGRFAFDNAWSFSQGLAVVARRKKQGYINLECQTAIPARYDRARNFSEGYAVVSLDGQYGLIDKKGSWVLAPEWEHLTNVHHKKTIGERGGEKIEVPIE